MKSRKTWQICNICGIKTRSLRLDENGFICYKHFMEKQKGIRIPETLEQRTKGNKYSFEKALRKENI